MADTSDFERLDHYLVRMGLAASRRAARELVVQSRVTVNGRMPRKGDTVGAGDRVEIARRATPSALIADDAAPIDVLYIDAAMLIVNKPGLMPCHPLAPGERGALMNAIVARFPETAAAGDMAREGGLVHRLDNGTSGAVMIARTREAHERLRRDLRAGNIQRRYQALVVGDLARTLEIDAPIGHRRRSARRMEIAARGARLRGHPRAASTLIEPLRRVGGCTLLNVLPHTGSRHQIRVHLKSAGLPIVNDTLYGAPRAPRLPAGRFWLHLGEIQFVSPAAGRVTVSAPLPADLAAFLASLERRTG